MLFQNNSESFTFIYYPVFALLESENLAYVTTSMQGLNLLKLEGEHRKGRRITSF